MIEKWSLPYPAHTGEEPRNVYVYIPDAYDKDDDTRYPVLYMFDGHNVFFDEDSYAGKSWGLGEYLDENETPLMVVAVECNQHPDNGRLSEYSPFDFQDRRFGSVIGRGEKTMEWFVNVLKPQIDEEYPTLPDREHTMIAGSSMGGLMSLYAVTRYNGVFSRAGALSPSVWVAPRKMDQLLSEVNIRPGTVVYMDYGSRELRNHRNMLRRYGMVTKKLLDRRVMVTSRIVPGGDHSEASWERQLPFLIQTLMYGMH